MIKVIQVFKKYASIPKPSFDSTARAEFAKWPPKVASQTGFLENGTLMLSDEWRDKQIYKKGAIIMMDTIQPTHQTTSEEQFYSFGRNSQQTFEIFNINYNDTGLLELHTRFRDLSGYTAFPQQSNHQIAVLHLNKPLRYQTNNRFDNTAAGFSMQRHFLLWDFILEYIGDATKVAYVSAKDLISEKRIQLSDCREIDERRIIR